MTLATRTEVVAYDFRRPGRLSDDVRQQLAEWQRKFCGQIVQRFGKHFEAEVDWQAGPIELQHGDPEAGNEEVGRVSHSIVIGEKQAGSDFHFPRPLLLALVGNILGESNDTLPDDRKLTNVEESLSELLIQEIVEAMNLSQPAVPPCLCRLEPPASEDDATLPEEEGESVVLAFRVTGGFGESVAEWALSSKAVSDFVLHHSQLSRQSLGSARPQLEALVRHIPVDMVVRLGETTIHVSELANLAPGDIVLLDRRITEPLMASVAGRERLAAWPGRIGSWQAIHVDSILDEEPAA